MRGVPTGAARSSTIADQCANIGVACRDDAVERSVDLLKTLKLIFLFNVYRLDAVIREHSDSKALDTLEDSLLINEAKDRLEDPLYNRIFKRISAVCS